MQLFVRCQEKHLVNLDATATAETVKAVIADREGIPEELCYVTAGGRILEGSLASAGVQPLSTVTVGVRMVGGKVHGSLARAGKVKGQTPKVEPQEKKKKKTGRAKRRIQYNKRFVNTVVGGPGKKRGPNSNSE
eukprot:CAMPEP_0182926002 /NCGR_PEP_ID=MMETSP0105_2-20130417/10774_1 /TAXON_ID=81532 ORGANISM="Acanthoeca-like sp., Strain 10tr" /NCGR_SAMPLE_ID=MMETSP0105_2 /ASSEMBLY_ACC=CAM_ASM_000205 /LENGTH=133 /DNA_ID=CAMNT_0025063873 /DNA_START=141 /DNA_END=542 /DNA_ORIENTATION=-